MRLATALLLIPLSLFRICLLRWTILMLELPLERTSKGPLATALSSANLGAVLLKDGVYAAGLGSTVG